MLDFLLESAVNLVWSMPVLCVFLFIHIYFTFKTRFVQKKLWTGIKLSLNGNKDSNISPFEALSLMLASALGTGNIIGVGTMIAIGGVGSVFWCWVSGIFAMATKYAETFICVKYKVIQKGVFRGGAMYVLNNVLHQKTLSFAFAFFTFTASFGIGALVQGKAVSDVCTQNFGADKVWTAIILTCLVSAVIFFGARAISIFCSFAVPAMSMVYILFCVLLLYKNFSCILPAIRLILMDAFNVKSALCGALSGSLLVSMRAGVSRGLFTNEAGLGSAPIASCESTEDCKSASLCAMSAVFWDTVVMCLATALCMVTFIVKHNITPLQIADGTTLAFMCFDTLPFGKTGVSICVAIFGFASVVGWCFFGQRGFEYVFGDKNSYIFRILWVVSVFMCPFLKAHTLWLACDLLNALMMFPNLYMLTALRKEIY